MPHISIFYGIVIGMFYNDHEPAHFHAAYGEYQMVVSINPIRVLQGSLPRRAQGLVLEWTAIHQEELLENWQLARVGKPLQRIAPLD
jgi:hypothetical protein